MKSPEKELNIFDYLPKVLPVLDVIFVFWLAWNSPLPWITTPIHIAMPVMGFSAIYFFKDKGRLGYYIIGVCTIIPAFALNCWGTPDFPSWLPEFSFITGGLLLSTNLFEKFVVLAFAFSSTAVPFWINHNSYRFTINVLIAELAIWFLLERSMFFMDLQRKKISAQKDLIEDKQKEIIDSIHYAKRIQDSLLPTERYISKELTRLN